jgi:hypothetical protein
VKDILEGIFILLLVVGSVYGRAKLWTVLFPHEDMFPWMDQRRFRHCSATIPIKKNNFQNSHTKLNRARQKNGVLPIPPDKKHA